jgi:cytochrome P450
MRAPRWDWSEAEEKEVAFSFDLETLDEGFVENPYPAYRAIRRHNPVCRLADGSYFISRYQHLVTIFRNPERFISDKKVDFKRKFGDSPLYEHHTTSVVFNDPPAHTRMRALMTPFFSPHSLATLRPRVEAFVDELLDRIEERKRFDLMKDFAQALPLNLVGDMLGVPEGERQPLANWAVLILGALEPSLTEENFRRGCEAVEEFKTYLRSLIASKRRSPAPRDDFDVLGALVDAESGGGRLSELELLHNCIFLLNAGQDTTTSLIVNGVDALFRFPDAPSELGRGREPDTTAVDEMLRLESPLQIGNRRCIVESELDGHRLPEGAFLHIGIGSANHDESVFEHSEQLDIERYPNKHLAFGKGIHTCAGNALGRLEAEIAVSKLLARFPDLTPTGKLVRGPRARFRSVVSYPMAV